DARLFCPIADSNHLGYGRLWDSDGSRFYRAFVWSIWARRNGVCLVRRKARSQSDGHFGRPLSHARDVAMKAQNGRPSVFQCSAAVARTDLAVTKSCEQ